MWIAFSFSGVSQVARRDLTPWLGRQDSKLRIPESNSLGAPEDGVAPLQQTPRVGPLMSWLTPAY
jgi:hypothetical protein